jgi:N-acetylmuramoyl-L-alanine amidase
MFIIGCGAPQDYTPQITAPAAETKPLYTPNMYKNSAPTAPKPKTSTYTSPSSNNSLDGKVIVIDPGHGGKDPGATKASYSSAQEKYLNLVIARELEKQLTKCGARVIMTRKSDTFLELEERSAVAQKYKPDLFIAIHTDANPHDLSICGPSVYVARSASQKSRTAAMKINASFRNWGFKPRGVRNADFKVLIQHSSPAVLIECGYLTNKQEAQRLNNPAHQIKIAKAIAEAVCQLQ